MSDDPELLRQLIDNINQFREATVESLKVLYRKQKHDSAEIAELRKIVSIVIVIVGLIVFVLVIATIARMVNGS